MARVSFNFTSSTDAKIRACLETISSAKYGKDARSAMANAINRLYEIAVLRAGSAQNGVTRTKIDEHIARISTAVFGEEVRDAFKTAITLCYSARGVAMPNAETAHLKNLTDAQLAEDLVNAILNSIYRCYTDVRKTS